MPQCVRLAEARGNMNLNAVATPASPGPAVLRQAWIRCRRNCLRTSGQCPGQRSDPPDQRSAEEQMGDEDRSEFSECRSRANTVRFDFDG
jgi:hypothetical protein